VATCTRSCDNDQRTIVSGDLCGVALLLLYNWLQGVRCTSCKIRLREVASDVHQSGYVHG
jgi:hypothetical protein